MSQDFHDVAERYNQNLLERDASFTKIRTANNVQQVEQNRVEHIVRLSGKDISDEVIDEDVDRLNAHYDETEYDYDEYEVEFVPDANDPIIQILTKAAETPMFSENKNKESNMYHQPQYSQAPQQEEHVKVINCFDGQPIRLPNGQFLLLPARIAPRVPVTVGFDDNGQQLLNRDGYPVLAFDTGGGTFVEWNPTVEEKYIGNQHGHNQNQNQQQPNYGGYGMQPAREEVNPNITDRYATANEPAPYREQYPKTPEPIPVPEKSKLSDMYIVVNGEEVEVIDIEKMDIRAVERFPELLGYADNYSIVAGYVGGLLTEFMVEKEAMERTIEYGGAGEISTAFEGGTVKDLPKATMVVKERPAYMRDIVIDKAELTSNSVSDMKSIANGFYYVKESMERDEKADHVLLSTVNYDVTMDDLTPIHDKLIDFNVIDTESYLDYIELIRSPEGGNVRTYKLIDKLVTRYINDLVRCKLNVVTVGIEIESFYEDSGDLLDYFKASEVPGQLESYIRELEVLFNKVIDFSLDDTNQLVMQISAPLVAYKWPLDIPEGRIIFTGYEELYFLIRSAARACGTNTVYVHTYDNNIYQVAINSELHTPGIFVTKKH